MQAPRPRGHRALPATALAFWLGLALAALSAGCGGTTPTPPAASSAPASAMLLLSPVDGYLTRIDADGLAKVKGFTLLLEGGTEVRFAIGVLENGAQFPPGHLAEHMSTSTPVRVYYEDEAGVHVAYRIEDAPEP